MSFMAQIKRLKELEELDTVLGWSDERKKAEYIGKVMKYKKFCNRAIALANSKIRDWCAYLQTYVPPALPPTLSTRTSATYVPVTPKPNSTRLNIPNDTKNFMHQTPPPTWHNNSLPFASTTARTGVLSTCYDDFNCDTPDLAWINHYLMGVFALLLCVVGVLANTLCVPSFNIHANRSSATFYMTGVAVCDTLFLILATLTFVMKNVPTDFGAQQKVYKTFSGYLIPSALPTLELVELMSFWIVIALLFDRFLYLRYGFHSKAICSRSLCAKVMLTIFGLLALYTAPKFLLYKIVEIQIAKPSGGNTATAAPGPEITHIVRVMRTQISNSETYHNVMTHWLKVPVEMFIPLLILAGFTGYFLFKVVENRGAWYDQIKGNRATPPALSNPLRTIVTERQVRQENVNILIALAIGLLVLVCKLPKFVAHVMVTETEDNAPLFLVAVRFLGLLCAALKPALYLGVGDHLHRGIFGMFWPSCRAHEEAAHEEIARVQIELNRVSSMAAVAAAAAATNAGTVPPPEAPGELSSPRHARAGDAGSPEECQPLNAAADDLSAVTVNIPEKKDNERQAEEAC